MPEQFLECVKSKKAIFFARSVAQVASLAASRLSSFYLLISTHSHFKAAR
jgi:hypothetical protein